MLFRSDESNPWRYSSGATGAAVASGTATYVSGDATEDGQFTGPNGSHNSLTVDISWLAGLNSQTIFHYTYECGNDNLMGKVSDGGTTVALLGVCLSGIALISRRFRI